MFIRFNSYILIRLKLTECFILEEYEIFPPSTYGVPNNSILDFAISLFRSVSFIYRGKYWVICERGTDARDNGYFFYLYLKQNHPDKKIYYFIDPNSSDFEKVREDAVKHGSIRSFWLAITAEKVVSSHYRMVIPYGLGKDIWKLTGIHKKFYFLQHGVIYSALETLRGDVAPMKAFICGAKPEFDFVSETFGHPCGVIKYTGLARYDRLHDFTIKKQILVMPTWRMYIRNEQDLLNSDYYSNWQKVINDKTLLDRIESSDIKLVFYVHYEMQKYIHLFSSISPNVIFARFDNFDVQTLLKESALLITDYSSVQFDFAYMRKPVVYFQFDRDTFYRRHYKTGYFDFENGGFGSFCKTANVAVDEVLKAIDGDFKMSSTHLSRSKDFFPLYDTKNCERIYNIITEK